MEILALPVFLFLLPQCSFGNYSHKPHKLLADPNDRAKLRVLFYHNPPDAFNTCGGHFPYLKSPRLDCRYPGHCIEILLLLTQYLGLHIEPVVHNTDILGGYNEKKEPIGLLALLANGSVDTICQLFSRTVNNRDMFDFSKTLYATYSWIAVRRYSEADQGMWNLFYPYRRDTWLAIGTMLFAQLLIFSVIYKLLESKFARRKTGRFEVLWRMFRVQLQQPDGVRFYSVSGRFQTVIFGLLQCMLFCSLYQSWIVTSLVAKSRDLPFQSLDELVPLVESGRYRFAAMPTDHWFFEIIETSNDVRYLRLRNAIKRFPLEIYSNATEVLKRVEVGRHVAILLGGSVLDWEAHRFCDVKFVQGGMPEKAMMFAFPRGSPFPRLINEAISHDNVFMHRKSWKYEQHWERQRDRHCLAHEVERKKNRPLSLIPIMGLGIVLFVGFALAMAAFAVEFFIFKLFHEVVDCNKWEPPIAKITKANALSTDELGTENRNDKDA